MESPEGYQGLIDNIDRSLTFAVEVEYGIEKREITNYEEVRCVTVVLKRIHYRCQHRHPPRRPDKHTYA